MLKYDTCSFKYHFKLNLAKINICLIPELVGIKNINNIKKYLSVEEIKKADISFLKNN